MSKVYLIGDLHGSFKPIRTFDEWNNHNQTFDDVMIVLGDFGGNVLFNYQDSNFKEKLGKYHMTYFIIRGNHEERPSILWAKNPDKWHAEEFFDGPVIVENDYPYIKYAADGMEFYEILGQNVLSIPGAYSVDKFYRIRMNKPWFENEQLSKAEMAEGEFRILHDQPQVDIVLSHTSPMIYRPTYLFLRDIDQSMVDTSMEEFLGHIELSLVPYKLWGWGHYHETRVYPKWSGGQPLMLFNDAVLDLNQFLASDNIYKGLKFFNKE